MSTEFHAHHRTRILCILTALWFNDACGQGIALPDLTHVSPTFDGVQSAAHQVSAADCHTAQCQAMLTIARVLQIDLDASASTVGVPRPIPPNRTTLARHTLEVAVLNKPGQFDAICQMATSIVARYSAPNVPGNVFVPVSLLNLAQAMDARGGRCLLTMLAALPNTAAGNDAIAHAHKLCTNAPEHQDCQAITRQ